MKKFLSLVMALVMTMSLVTIGAGATEYANFSDKSEVQYEEAVAVLNKIGIITGYEDGSFKPAGALTRGAAAKIIVSLMIGSEAASALSVTAAPYKDVPVTNTFAGVISYCKTAGYINGYSDGTFRPTAALTGYAFSKMLLGALGYDGKIEGFTGEGWTMNVARLGKVAGLFDDFKTTFQGNAGLTREGACLLALNTLKATEVEYVGGTSVTAGTASVVINAERQLKTSNNKNINQNIGKTKENATSEYTLEFGEDHFADLKLANEGSATDDFGRPANKWTYKNVSIGSYAITPDYVFTARASGDTTTDKLKSMGLNDLNVDTKTAVYINNESGAALGSKTAIPGLTGNGRLVEVYLDGANADLIKSVVVVDTFVMQVKKVTSSGVTLKSPESNRIGSVNEVKSDDDCYAALKNLKADDYVLVTAASDSVGGTKDVMSVTVPQTVSGKLTAFTAGSHNATGVNKVTVADTSYNLAFQADSADSKLSASTKLTANNNTTVYLDTYGNVIYATNVDNGSDYFVYDEMYSSVVDGKIVNYAKGWDLGGDAVSLNLGTSTSANGIGLLTAGGVYEYDSSTTSNAEYQIVGGVKVDGTVVGTSSKIFNGGTNALAAGLSSIDNHYFDGSMKTTYVSWDNATDVSGVTVKDGFQKKDSNTDRFVYVLDNSTPARIKYIVVLNDTDVEASSNVLYVKSADGTATVNGKTVTMFDAYIDGQLQTGLKASQQVSAAGKFYTYTVTDGVYSLHAYTQTTKNTSVKELAEYSYAGIYAAIMSNNAYLDKSFDDSNGTSKVSSPVSAGVNTVSIDLYCKASGIEVIDCSGDGYNLTSLEDIKELYDDGVTTIQLAIEYNGNITSNAYGNVARLYIRDVSPAKA